jgi:Transposase, Mutator family
VTRNRGQFPSEQAALKVLYLAVRNLEDYRGRSVGVADQLLARAGAGGVELLGPDGLLSQVTKAVLERALGEEMTAHLGYEKHDPAGRGSGNSRNGPAGGQLVTDRIHWLRREKATAAPTAVLGPSGPALRPRLAIGLTCAAVFTGWGRRLRRAQSLRAGGPFPIALRDRRVVGRLPGFSRDR